MTPAELPRYEECCICGVYTGKAGPGDGSLYCVRGEPGPMCEECFDRHKETCDAGCKD